MTELVIGAGANQTLAEYPRDVGERKFAEAIEAICKGEWSWAAKVDEIDYFQRGAYRCDVFLSYRSTTDYGTKLIERGHNNDNVVTLLDTAGLGTELLGMEISEPAIDSRVIQEFARGIGGDPTPREIVRTARLIVQACWEYTNGAHISFDDEDGNVDFHLRLRNGHLVMANFFLNGDVDASVYDDSQGPPVKLVRRLRRGRTSGEDLIELFRSGR
jgi:hypothetical protein